MSTQTYIAWLPSEKDFMVKLVVDELSKVVDSDPNASSHIEFINSKLDSDIIQSKFIAHHSTLFFTKKNTNVVTEGDTLHVYLMSMGWNKTNVVLFVDFKRDCSDQTFITDQFENADLTHITFCCQKEKGGKAVNSRFVPRMIDLTALNIVISGTVHELWKENSERVVGGIKPVTPVSKPKAPKKVTHCQIFLEKFTTYKNIPKSEIGPYMRQFNIDFMNKQPTPEEIDTYISSTYPVPQEAD